MELIDRKMKLFLTMLLVSVIQIHGVFNATEFLDDFLQQSGLSEFAKEVETGLQMGKEMIKEMPAHLQGVYGNLLADQEQLAGNLVSNMTRPFVETIRGALSQPLSELTQVVKSQKETVDQKRKRK